MMKDLFDGSVLSQYRKLIFINIDDFIKIEIQINYKFEYLKIIKMWC